MKRGWDITVITEQYDESLPLLEKLDEMHILRIPKDQTSSKLKLWKWMINHREIFFQCDVIHCHDVFWWYLPIRMLNYKVPVFTTFHGYEGSGVPTKKAIRSRKISELLSKGSICVGDWMRGWYNAYPDVVFYGATTAKPAKAIQNNKAVFIGRLSEDTGVLEYIQAIKSLNGKISLDIFGEGDLLLNVKKEIKKIPYIHYQGVTNHAEDLYGDYEHVFVSRYLGMIEALAVGRNVYAHWNNEIKKDYLKSFPKKDAIFIFHTSDEVAKKLLKPQQKNDELLFEAQAWALKQTWENAADVYEELWKK